VKKLITSVAATAMIASAILVGAASSASAAGQSPQQAVNQGAASAAAQGFDQHVSVRDRNTGALLAQSSNANEVVASESLAKLFTATYDIVAWYGSYTNAPASLLNRLAYMIEYSDDATENSQYSGSDVPYVVARYGLSGATNNGSNPWSGIHITANDESLLIYRVLKDPAIGPWMGAVMAQSKPTGSDGFNQHFGFNALGGVHGSKQGWGSEGFNGRPNTISSVGYTDKYTGAILSTAPAGGGYANMSGPDTYTAQLIQNSVTAAPAPPKPAPARMMQSLDSFTAAGGQLGITGWAYDPANPGASSTVTLYVSGRAPVTVTANTARPDVDRAFGIPGNHGFALRLPAGPGHYTVYFAAHAASGTNSVTVLSRTLTTNMTIPTAGHLDSATATPGSVTVAGWAYDRVSSSVSNRVMVSVNGKVLASPLADHSRPDVDSALHITGNHGFVFKFLQPTGHSYNVCVTSQPISQFSTPRSLGCKTVNA